MSEQKVRAELRAQETLEEEALRKDADEEGNDVVSDGEGEERADEEHSDTGNGRRKSTRRKRAPCRQKKRKVAPPPSCAQRMTPAGFIILGLQLEDTK